MYVAATLSCDQLSLVLGNSQKGVLTRIHRILVERCGVAGYITNPAQYMSLMDAWMPSNGASAVPMVDAIRHVDSGEAKEAEGEGGFDVFLLDVSVCEDTCKKRLMDLYHQKMDLVQKRNVR